MKTESQIFSWRRFGQTLRRDFMLNGRQLALNGGMMFGVITLFLIFISILFVDNMYITLDSPTEFYEARIADTYKTLQEVYSVFFLILGAIFCSLGASMFATNLSTTGKRINELMSPSSHSEKYLSRFIICIICVPVAFCASFALADLISMLVVRICYGFEHTFIMPVPMSFLGNKIYISIIAGSMTYMLGSTLWPKYSFVKTFLALMIIQFVVSIAAVASFTLIDIKSFDITSAQLKNAYYIYVIVWSLFCVTASYFRMKKIEIIKTRRLW